MGHKLYCITGSKQYDITPIVGSVSWKSDTEQLGVQLDFEIAYNDTRFFPVNPVDLGSMLILYGAAEIFRGLAITEQKNGRAAIQYTCLDPAFYLNKSKGVYQFNGMPANQAITKMLTDFSVPIGSIAAMSTPITKIYNDKVMSEIIKDILSQVTIATGNKYRLEMRAGKIYIENQQDLVITPTFQIALNAGPVACTAAITNPTRKRSIEEMKNSIQIISNNQVVAELKDEALIAKYGLLQEVQTNDGSVTDLQAAQSLLDEFGKIIEDNGLDLPGNDEVRAGRILAVEEPITGMTGQYLISNVQHTDTAGIHTMNLNLGVV